jgi:hypothetical protein
MPERLSAKERAKRKAKALYALAESLDKQAREMPPTYKEEAGRLHRMADRIRQVTLDVYRPDTLD